VTKLSPLEAAQATEAFWTETLAEAYRARRGIEDGRTGLPMKHRCATCYSKKQRDVKVGRFCHRCGGEDELT
jgi:hypothetical protein